MCELQPGVVGDVVLDHLTILSLSVSLRKVVFPSHSKGDGGWGGGGGRGEGEYKLRFILRRDKFEMEKNTKNNN